MFGTSNAQPQNNNSLFGQSTAQGTSNPFGQSTAPNLFGQSTTTNNNPLTASTLLPTRGPSTPGQADQFDVLKRRIEGVAQDWGAVPGGQGKFQVSERASVLLNCLDSRSGRDSFFVVVIRLCGRFALRDRDSLFAAATLRFLSFVPSFLISVLTNVLPT